MQLSKTVVWLSTLIAILALIAAAVGLFYQAGGSPFAVTTVRGETVLMYGQGLYRYETLRDGSGFKGADAFVLIVGIPLLILFTLLYRRGSLKGALLLTGMLAYFLYNSASMTFGYAYNNLFLLYLAQFTASLFAFILAFKSINLGELPAHFSPRLPYRGIAIFQFIVGLSLIIVWVGLDILPALLQGQAPNLAGHTTLPTHALDVGVIAPVAFLAGVLLLRRAPLGYLLAAIILVIGGVLGLGVVALSAAQLLAGVLTPAETVVFVLPFVILTFFSLWFLAVLFRHCTELAAPIADATAWRTAHA